jgi:hypothetical protein
LNTDDGFAVQPVRSGGSGSVAVSLVCAVSRFDRSIPTNARPDANNARIAKEMALAETVSTAITIGARSSSEGDVALDSPTSCIAMGVSSSGESTNAVSLPVGDGDVGVGVVPKVVEVGSVEVDDPVTVDVGVPGAVVESGDPGMVVVGVDATVVEVGVPAIAVVVVVGVPGRVVVVDVPGIVVVVGVPGMVVVTTVVVVTGVTMSAVTWTASMCR